MIAVMALIFTFKERIRWKEDPVRVSFIYIMYSGIINARQETWSELELEIESEGGEEE